MCVLLQLKNKLHHLKNNLLLSHYFCESNLVAWDSLMVQWLRLCVSTTGGTGSSPGWEIKIPNAAVWPSKKRDLGAT